MAALIPNEVKIGAGSIVAAGTLILERTEIPPGSLVVGHPGKVKRPLTGVDQAAIDAYAKRYVEYKNIYREKPTDARKPFFNVRRAKLPLKGPSSLCPPRRLQRRI